MEATPPPEMVVVPLPPTYILSKAESLVVEAAPESEARPVTEKVEERAVAPVTVRDPCVEMLPALVVVALPLTSSVLETDRAVVEAPPENVERPVTPRVEDSVDAPVTANVPVAVRLAKVRLPEMIESP